MGNPKGSIKWIPDETTLVCSSCGHTQTYSNKYSYRRAMGVGSDQTQKNKGLCGKCSRAAEREKWTLSKESAELRRVNAYNYAHNTNYTSIDELPNARSTRRYKKVAMKIAQTTLKRENLTEYQRYVSNKWDGTDLDQLTIDHKHQLWKCERDGLTPNEASRIENLQVICMRENILRENPNAKFKDKKQIVKQKHNWW